MQITDPISDDRPNWALGMRGLFVASAMFGVSNASGSPLAMYAAVLVAGWAFFKPLRFGHWLLAAATLRAGGLAALTVVAVVVMAFLLSHAVNSDVQAVSIFGNLSFLALVGAVVVVAVRLGWIRGTTWAPRVWASSTDAASQAWSQVLVWRAVIGR